MARVLPVVTDWNRFYWTSGADGRLRFQYCTACGSLQHPPGPRCRRCRSDLLGVREVSGDGVVQSCTTNVSSGPPIRRTRIQSPWWLSQRTIGFD